jgi:hypothetical protein
MKIGGAFTPRGKERLISALMGYLSTGLNVMFTKFTAISL